MKSKVARLGLIFILTGILPSALASGGTYGIASVGLLQSDVTVNAGLESTNNTSYKLGLGYELSRQWYFELQYQKILDDADGSGMVKANADALYGSFLGKAANRTGELFYRIGLGSIKLDRRETFLGPVNCSAGFTVELDANNDKVCVQMTNIASAVIGLGFDWYVGLKSMVRVETEYARGQEDFSSRSVFIGYRYNF